MGTKVTLKYTKGTFLACTNAVRQEYKEVQHHVLTDGTITAHADTRKKVEDLFHLHIYAQPAQEITPYKPGTGSWL